MIGDGQDDERTGYIAVGVALHWDRDQPIDVDVLQGVLDQPRTTVWCGASVVPNESTDRIWPRLTGTEPGTCRFAAAPDAVERRWELGATGHGPTGTQLAERVCEQIRAWDRNRADQPVITAYPASTPVDEPTRGQIIDKQFTRLVVAF